MSAKRWTWLLLVALWGCMSLAAAEVDQTDVTERTFRLGAAPHILVDNVNGSIDVEGHPGDVIELTVRRRLRADSGAKAAEAREKERLEITEEDGRLLLYVDGPYRLQDGGMNYRGRRYYGWESDFDFTLRVPAAASLDVRTVNRGDITVRNTTGDFQVNNVNGGVVMSGVAGSGRAYALNKPLEVTLARNPRSASYFGSLNGDVEVEFAAGLAADIRVKTFNGKVYSDFPVKSRPSAPPTEKMSGGMRVIKTSEFTALRIGAGGPEITFDAFNGDVRILSRRKQ